MEYLIQENTLIEIADALRDKLVYKDIMYGIVADRNKIATVEIPEGATIIRKNVFANCDNLADVIIPKGVTHIDYGAFQYCKNLKSIIIPNSVVDIFNYAFTGCTSLTDMYLHSVTPPTLGSYDPISSYTTTIHVPVGSGNAYKTATNWSNYADKIVEDIIVE